MAKIHPTAIVEDGAVLAENVEVGPMCFVGRNVTIVVEDGQMDLGEFGRIHFIDWDQTRGRNRTVQVMVMGE